VLIFYILTQIDTGKSYGQKSKFYIKNIFFTLFKG